MRKSTFSIAVSPGDGIGREVMVASLVLNVFAPRIGRSFATTEHPAGARNDLDSGDSLPASTLSHPLASEIDLVRFEAGRDAGALVLALCDTEAPRARLLTDRDAGLCWKPHQEPEREHPSHLTGRPVAMAQFDPCSTP